MKFEDIVKKIESLNCVDFSFTKVGEYIFTTVSDTYPLCSNYEFGLLLKLQHADYYLSQPIDYATLKSLVYDARGVCINRANYGGL